MNDHDAPSPCEEHSDPLVARLDQIESQLQSVVDRLDEMHRWIADAVDTDGGD